MRAVDPKELVSPKLPQAAIENPAPRTAGTLTDQGLPTTEDRYDLLFTTDVLSEGVNLQQAGRMINYDLPWNPMRLVQRAGRIDRIGSNHDYITIGCFFPEAKLDELLHLEATLMRKLAYADAAIGTGEILPSQKCLLVDPRGKNPRCLLATRISV